MDFIKKNMVLASVFKAQPNNAQADTMILKDLQFSWDVCPRNCEESAARCLTKPE